MADISDWSTTAASNNATPPDGAPEGMAPSGVNDVIRELMAAVRRWYEDAQWVNLGLTHTRVSSSSFSLTGDYTGTYEVGRRVKMTGSATGYGTISASSYSAPDTTVTLSTNTVPATLSTVSLSVLSVTNSAVPGTFSGDKSFSGAVAVTATSSPAMTITVTAAGKAATFTDGSNYTISLKDKSGAWVGSEAGNVLKVGANDLTMLSFSTAGNLTIATPTSGATLTVNVPSAGTAMTISDAIVTYATTLTATRLNIGTSSAHDVSMISSGSDRLRITSGGDVRVQTGLLRVASAAADPTGANGDIYYNTVTNKFRGYANGWADLN